MSLINRLSIRLQNHPKRVVFPEGSDPRIIQAARQFATRGLGVPILLGDRSEIKTRAAQLDIKLDKIRILEPARSAEMDIIAEKFHSLPRFEGLSEQEALGYLSNNNYFATMLLATAHADAMVSGATSLASSPLRPLFQIIPMQSGVHTASSMLILEQEESTLGIDGALFLADCGVIPEPNEEQLADIAITTAGLVHHLTNQTPLVAMLSFSTKHDHSKHPGVQKMKTATSLACHKVRELGMSAVIDGELQVDAALDSFIAERKQINSPVAGKANVLIFPDLHSGNIASKLAQMITGSRSYGQIITGLAKPAAEISRGASAHDIFGTSVIVAAQAVDRAFLYPVD